MESLKLIVANGRNYVDEKRTTLKKDAIKKPWFKYEITLAGLVQDHKVEFDRFLDEDGSVGRERTAANHYALNQSIATKTSDRREEHVTETSQDGALGNQVWKQEQNKIRWRRQLFEGAKAELERLTKLFIQKELGLNFVEKPCVTGVTQVVKLPGTERSWPSFWDVLGYASFLNDTLQPLPLLFF